jgi:hypothetical protein
MSVTRTERPRLVPLTVLVIAALLCGLVVTLSAGQRAEADSGPGHRGHGNGQLTQAQLAFHDEMRRLWEDHVTWTRLAIVTFADGSDGFGATAERLLQNQEDIGDAVEPFYGTAAGDRLTALLRDHITIAVELLQAAQAGDSAALDDASTRWYDNADQVAGFLTAANPRHWPADVLRDAMRAHLDQTLTEASAELQGDHALSIATYEEIHHHILDMADLLSSGIVKQFPDRFRR